MTDYGLVFPDFQYRKLAERAVAQYKENPKSQVIPMLKAEKGTREYTHVNLTAATGGEGVEEFTEEGLAADITHYGDTFKLDAMQMHLWIPNTAVQSYQSDELYIADKKEAKLAKFMSDLDNANFHGVLNGNGNQMHEGILGQASIVENLQGTDSTLDAKGEIFDATKTMIDAIPFEMRESAPPMVLMMSENLAANANDKDRIYNDKTEWELIYENFIGSRALSGRKIGQVIVSNKILAESYDDTSGDGADSADTKGTHDRMLLFIPDKRYMARVISRPFSLLGEEQSMLGNVHQLWGWRGRGCVFDSDAVQYSERIVWT